MLRVVAASCVVVIIALPAAAQSLLTLQDSSLTEQEPPAATEQTPDPYRVNTEPPVAPQFRLRLGAYHLFETDVDGGGEVESSGASIRFDTRLRIDDPSFLDFTFGYEYDSFDFSGSGTLTGLDPWNDVHGMVLRAVYNRRIDEQWGWFAGPVIGLTAEDGADYSNSVVWGAQGGARYRASEKFSIGFGLTAITQVDDDPWVVPLVFFNWDFADNWTLRAGSFDIGSQGGPGFELAWRFAPRWELSAGLGYERRRFRLDDGAVAPEGVGQFEGFSAQAKIAWVYHEKVRIWLAAGLAFEGNLRLEDDDGRKIVDEDFDTTPLISLRFSINF
jgi:hypothetical protein